MKHALDVALHHPVTSPSCCCDSTSCECIPDVQMVADLAANQSINVQAFALNYRLPMSCIMTTGPMSRMGRCKIGDDDMRLSEAKWQTPLAQGAPKIAMFQDTVEANVWDRGFGGGHDDVFVYDATGRLFAWLPSAMTDPHPKINQDMLTPSGYDAVRATVILASQQPRNRCDAPPPEYGCWAGLIASPLLAVVLVGVLWWRHQSRKPSRLPDAPALLLSHTGRSSAAAQT